MTSIHRMNDHPQMQETQQLVESHTYKQTSKQTNKQQNSDGFSLLKNLQCKKRDSRGKASKFQESFLPRPRHTGWMNVLGNGSQMQGAQQLLESTFSNTGQKVLNVVWFFRIVVRSRKSMWIFHQTIRSAKNTTCEARLANSKRVSCHDLGEWTSSAKVLRCKEHSSY